MNFKNIFNGIAAVAVAAATLFSCQKQEVKNSLSVNPSSQIDFAAVNAEEVVLNVTTDAGDWAFEVPEWVEASKAAKNLVVKASDNTTGEERLGRIVIKAGNAEDVKIIVTQAAANGGENPGEGAKAVFQAVGETSLYASATETALTAEVKVVLADKAESDVVFAVSIDEPYLAEYNYINGESHVLFPVNKVGGLDKLTVKAGETESNTVTVSLDATDIEWAQGYLVPLLVKVESGNATVKGDDARVNLLAQKVNTRKIKNVVYFEVNDCNPLNALEYMLADGTPFFDAVILFAANINYNSTDDVVFLSNNPNVQALLDESEVYIQPLRKKGIKVYLGLLGNHDAAGLCQLSDWGAQEYAKEVAEACKTYKLDGVNLDDEYSNSPDLSNKWFAPRSDERGARLEYELKKAMKKTCSWPTEVSHFDCGALHSFGNVTDLETGVEHTPSEFCDFHVADYGGASSPFGDLTMANCSGASIQLNYGDSISESKAKSCLEDGYGWIMWFAFDPSGTGSISSNRSHSITQFQNVARGCYGQDLAPVTGVWNKIGEGKYDPERHAL